MVLDDRQIVFFRKIWWRPVLLGFELGNECLIKSRRQPTRLGALAAALRLRDGLAVEGD